MNTMRSNTSDGNEAQTTPTPGAASEAPQTSRRLSSSEQLKSIEALIRGQNEEDDSGNGDEAAQGVAEPENAGSGAGEAQPPETEPDSEGGAEGEAAGPDAESGAPAEDTRRTVKDVSEALGVTEAELYAMEVSTRDGETISLGELKDAYQEREALAAEMQEKADTLKSREGGLATDIMTLGVLDAMRVIPEENRAKAVKFLSDKAEQQYNDFLHLYPDYQDDAKRMAVTKEFEDFADKAGFNLGEIPLKSVGFYTMAMRVVEMQRELKKLKTPKARTAPKAVKRNRAKPPPAKPVLTGSRGRRAELEGIAQLLRG